MTTGVTDLAHARLVAAHKTYQRLQGQDCSVLEGLPILVRTQGLPFALAYASKSLAALPGQVASWLTQGVAPTPLKGRAQSLADLLTLYVQLNSADAAAVEQEAARFIEALKLVHTSLKGA